MTPVSSRSKTDHTTESSPHASGDPQTNQRLLILVGTFTETITFGSGHVLEGRGKGIYSYWLNIETGALESEQVTTGVKNPSYVAVSPDRRFLYSVNELKEFEGQATGTVSSFAFDPRTRTLTYQNKRITGGTDPCHVTVSDDGAHVFVANFMSGSIAVYSVQENGDLSEMSDYIQHSGSSVNPMRQAGPHAHSVILDRQNRFAFVPDLGLDKLMIYRFDRENGTLRPASQPSVKMPPGAGPRHLVFHPTARWAYIINELDSTITAFLYDETNGTLTEIDTVSTLPAHSQGDNSCADIQISPSGMFLYGSNRGHDSIAIYRINQDDGTIEPSGHESTAGKTPRSFVITPSGEHLLVANQDSNNVVTFKVDQTSGGLDQMVTTAVPTPVCLKAISI